MQTNIADKALIITPLHTTRQVLGQGNRHQTNWRYILEILAVADTCHCAQLVFVQYLIDPIDTSFTTRVRNNVLSESIRNAHIGAPFISFDGFSVIHGSTKIMMFSSTAGDSAHLNNKGETRYSRVRLIKPWSYKLSHVLQRYQYCRIYLINLSLIHI